MLVIDASLAVELALTASVSAREMTWIAAVS
jgi:hypothetical protein